MFFFWKQGNSQTGCVSSDGVGSIEFRVGDLSRVCRLAGKARLSLAQAVEEKMGCPARRLVGVYGQGADTRE